MIPKIGETVRISEEFVMQYDMLYPIIFVFNDFKVWLNSNRNKDLLVYNLTISHSDEFMVEVETSSINTRIPVDKNGFSTVYNNIKVPFFTYNKKSVIDINSNMYCSCSSPQLKDVFISPNLQYKFCQICKRERQ
jgi:hypothetical protein